MPSQSIETRLERFLLQVEKPGRYVGGEYNSVVKDWASTDIKVALAFPDIYDLGMSNLGIMNLYNQVNLHENMLAERVFSPWLDMESLMREQAIPLYSLESKTPVRNFDLLGISLPYEQLYTNALNLLDLAGLPILSRDRDARYPLVIAGGHACFNPEPMADFIDAFVIGEGEEIIVEIANALSGPRGKTRDEQLREIAKIQGMYVPRFYDLEYNDDGTVRSIEPNMPGIPERVLKRIVITLPKPFTKFIVPNIDTVHNARQSKSCAAVPAVVAFATPAWSRVRSVNVPSRKSWPPSPKSFVTPASKRSACSASRLPIMFGRRIGGSGQSSIQGRRLEPQLAQPAHRKRQRRPARENRWNAPQRFYFRAGSGYRKDARSDQQVRARRSSSSNRPRCLFPRLAHDQILFHDRPPRGISR